MMKTPVLRFLFLMVFVIVTARLFAQFPPPAGHHGTTAMNKDSSAFIAWGSTCTIQRGFVNIADTMFTYNGSNRTAYGSYLYATGPADELVVSLGDHGSATLGFENAIKNRPGPDFAIFENSFGDSFLELAFVEVSSDGEHFVRFPAVSLTPVAQQVNTFDTIDATKINNFAGKYRQAYGTPFDLQDIIDSTGIDLNKITAVRIIDAVGCLQDAFATTDSQGHKVNDPWPTPFDTGGFDLDAVGVIHNQSNGIEDSNFLSAISVYPNPVTENATVDAHLIGEVILKITDPSGHVLMTFIVSGKSTIDLRALPAGIYLAVLTSPDGASYTRKIIKY
jgi:hypothetical protein